MKTVVIIGAGFSGTVLAAELLRQSPAGVRIVLVNRSGLMARGLAYGTNSALHLLNVPAGNMSAYSDQPDHFLNYCKAQDPTITRSSFISRKMYGEYLSFVLECAEKQKKTDVIFERIDGEVSEIIQEPDVIALQLSDGSALNTDHVVLALGNFSPADPLRLESTLGSGYYTRDPWAQKPHKDIASLEDSILLMGTGLTSLDVAIKLVQSGHRGPIYMVSRRGLLPLPHRKISHHALANTDFLDKLLKCRPSALNYMKIIRQEINVYQHTEQNWRDIIAAIRPITAKLWRSLDAVERRRFLRHVQPYWDVHRHRVAPASFDMFEQLCLSGQVQIIAGRIKGISLLKNKLLIHIKLRKTQSESTVEVSRIINCTGPNTNIKWMNERLLTQLTTSKLIQTDKHGLGILVNDDLSVINDRQNGATTLSYIGPMLKATYWEATAVPELRKYAAQLAKLLIQRLKK